ncbi:MAG: hypothetical protein IJ806_09195 [Ruminococcus sp.]|nr:hypothetical protein [Ruminococcus sp.]
MIKKITALMAAAAMVLSAGAFMQGTGYTYISAEAVEIYNDSVAAKLSSSGYSSAVSYLESSGLYFEKDDGGMTVTLYATGLGYDGDDIDGMDLVKKSGSFLYTQNGSKLTVVGYTGNSTSIKFPAALNGSYVTNVGPYECRLTFSFDSKSCTDIVADYDSSRFLLTSSAAIKSKVIKIELPDSLKCLGDSSGEDLDNNGSYSVIRYGLNDRRLATANIVKVYYKENTAIADFINSHRDVYETGNALRLIQTPASYLNGDIDGDGILSYLDIDIMIGLINQEKTVNDFRFDMARSLDGDDDLTYLDISVLMNMISGER